VLDAISLLLRVLRLENLFCFIFRQKSIVMGRFGGSSKRLRAQPLALNEEINDEDL
jgi:hypothetical protein